MRNWQRDAPLEIARAVEGLSADATLAERKKALRAHAYQFHLGTSWGKKVWAKHCRRYLAQFGAVAPAKQPTFADDIIFPFRTHPAGER